MISWSPPHKLPFLQKPKTLPSPPLKSLLFDREEKHQKAPRNNAEQQGLFENFTNQLWIMENSRGFLRALLDEIDAVRVF